MNCYTKPYDAVVWHGWDKLNILFEIHNQKEFCIDNGKYEKQLISYKKEQDMLLHPSYSLNDQLFVTY